MRLPRPRRLILALALLAWVGAVWWHWRWHLPAVPIDVVPFSAGWCSLPASAGVNALQSSAILDNGHLVLARSNPRPRWADEVDYSECRGPIRIWDPVHHRVVREIETPRDLIDYAIIFRRGVALLVADETVTVVDLLRGRVTLLGDRHDNFVTYYSPDGQFVVLEDPETRGPAVYDTQTGQLAFVSPKRQSSIVFDDHQPLAFLIDPSKRGWVVLDVQTWKPVDPQGRNSETGSAMSRDDVLADPELIVDDRPFHGRWVLGRAENFDVLIDLEEARAVARFPREDEQTISEWTFCRNGQEFVQLYMPGPNLTDLEGAPPDFEDIGDARLQIIRRSTSDGQTLAHAVVRSPRVVPVSPISPDGRLFIGCHGRRALNLPMIAHRIRGALGIYGPVGGGNELVAIDTVTGEFIAPLAPLREDFSPFWYSSRSLAEFSDGLICVVADGQLRSFAYPLQRRWLWLIGWSLTPPAALWLLSSGWRRWRRRQHPAITPPAAVA